VHNPLTKQIWQFIHKHDLLPAGSRVVLGFSGGPDSVFLLHFFANVAKTGQIELIAAHLDHEWRPESAQDEQFCKTMADELGISYISAKASELKAPFILEGSKEELGRKLRRFFLEKVCAEHNATCIALAHHLQDQEETFFIRLMRGATLTGLTCMWPKSGLYIRPLLEINKDDIVRYLELHRIPYLVDPTNIEPLYLRNRIRNNVLPVLRETDDRFDLNFLKTVNHLQDADRFLEKLTHDTLTKTTWNENNKCTLFLPSFFQLDPFLQKRVLLQWLIGEKVIFKPSEGLLTEIIRFAQQEGSKKHQIHQSWAIIKKKNQLYITKL